MSNVEEAMLGGYSLQDLQRSRNCTIVEGNVRTHETGGCVHLVDDFTVSFESED